MSAVMQMTRTVESRTAGETKNKERYEPVRVLLIEDNPSDARLIEVMIEGAGEGSFEVEHVERLSAGIQRLKQGN